MPSLLDLFLSHWPLPSGLCCFSSSVQSLSDILSLGELTHVRGFDSVCELMTHKGYDVFGPGRCSRSQSCTSSCRFACLRGSKNFLMSKIKLSCLSCPSPASLLITPSQCLHCASPPPQWLKLKTLDSCFFLSYPSAVPIDSTSETHAVTVPCCPSALLPPKQSCCPLSPGLASNLSSALTLPPHNLLSTQQPDFIFFTALRIILSA